jgi:hypothetical protein
LVNRCSRRGRHGTFVWCLGHGGCNCGLIHGGLAWLSLASRSRFGRFGRPVRRGVHKKLLAAETHPLREIRNKLKKLL